MRLANKTFLYSVVISLVVGIAILGYMLFMLPPLYMEYKSNENLVNSKEMLQHLTKKESLTDANFNDDSSFGFIIPKEGYKIKISNSSFKGEIEPTDEFVKNIIDSIRKIYLNDYKKKNFDFKKLGQKIEENIKIFFDKTLKNFEKDFKYKFEGNETINFREGDIKFHSVSQKTAIVEMSVINKSTGTKYTSYIGISKQKGKIFMLVSNVITPTTEDIKPVIYKAIPVFIPFIILLAFCISAIYSKKIIKPIEDLDRDAKMRRNQGIEYTPIAVETDDEIGNLAKSLNLLYESQTESFKKMRDEGRRKEIFMRSSSHQLKTPIAAATLLVDSMISNVGKFTDRDKYLPMLKDKLVEMRKIVDKVLTLNHLSTDEDRSYVDVAGLCEAVSKAYKIEIDSKCLELSVDTDEYSEAWHSNGEMLRLIVDNLVSNAVKYCGTNGFVKIKVSNDSISVRNAPGNIDESVKASIFEPFVSGSENGHGLGLYVSKYFASLLKMKLEIEEKVEEDETVVVATLRNQEAMLND